MSQEKNVKSGNRTVLPQPRPPGQEPLEDFSRSPSFFKVLGVRVEAVKIAGAIAQMARWISDHDVPHLVAATGMHGVTEAQHDASFKLILNSVDLVVPDGMPLVWIGWLRGYRLLRRVPGSDLLAGFCRETAKKRYRHFFYGGAPGVPEKLAEELKSRFDGLQVVGAYSPPFRSLQPEEDAQIVEMINNSDADVLWVGLGCPKQERWMWEHRESLKVPVVVAIGAAFDFFTGGTPRAPAWMCEHGLEWLFRLVKEPRRLWRRYLVYGSEFAWSVSLELLGLRRFS